jgi:hypothetical protein
MQFLKQSTAATVEVGPVLDANGDPYTGAVIGDFNITKNGTTAAMAASATATHSHNGTYLIALTTGNTDTLGRLSISMNKATYAMTIFRYEVLAANQFDAIVTNGNVTPPAIADAVWDEAYSGHTTAGTFGKLMDILRKSNNVIEGTILASPTPTTTVFRISGANYPTGALEHSVLWMSTGTSAEQNSPILTTVNNGDGTLTITLEEALTTAPVAGDVVLIDPTSHVHAIADIASGIWSAASSAYSAATGTMGLIMYAFSQMLELVTGVWRWKATSLSQAPAGGGNNVVNVLPAVGISAERQAGVVLSPFVGETISQSITLYATDGTTPINLSGKSLEIVFQTRSGTDVAVIANANITISGTSNNIVTFAYPSAVTTTERTLRVSLRDNAAPRTVYLSGLCKVSIAPAVDA